MLSSQEVQALEAILDDALVKSRDEDGYPVFHEVEVDGVNPFGDKSIQDGVYDSLAKKGLIECSGMNVDPVTDEAEKEYVCITPEGLEALKSAKGVN